MRVGAPILLLALNLPTLAFGGGCKDSFKALDGFLFPPTLEQLAKKTGKPLEGVRKDYKDIMEGAIKRRAWIGGTIAFGLYIPVVIAKHHLGGNLFFNHYSNFFQTMAGAWVYAGAARAAGEYPRLGERFPLIAAPFIIAAGFGVNYIMEASDAATYRWRLDIPDIIAGTIGASLGVLLEAYTHRVDMHKLQQSYKDLEARTP